MPKPATTTSANPADVEGGEEVVVECWENHRYSPFSGWGPTTSGLDRPAWSTKKGDKTVCRESFLLPVGWSWVTSWNVEPHKENMEGWYYAPDFSISTRFCSSKQAKLSMVRRRKWVRTRRNFQAELELVASVRSLRPTIGGGGPSVLANESMLSTTSSTGTWMTVPEPRIFVPDFCFRYSTWTATASYGFSGASLKALEAEQNRCHLSFIRLQGLLASTEFFDTHHTNPNSNNNNNGVAGGSGSTLVADGGANSGGGGGPLSASPKRGSLFGSREGVDSLGGWAIESGSASAGGAAGNSASHNQSQQGGKASGDAPATTPSSPVSGIRSRGGTFNNNAAASPNGASSSSSSKPPPVLTTVPEKVLATVYKYGVAPPLRRHLWVAWSGAGAKKAANAGLFQRLATEAAAIMEKGHAEGTNEMLAEILQDVVRTAPRHPFFEHSQVLSLMRTKKTLASPHFSPVSQRGGGGGLGAGVPSSPPASHSGGSGTTGGAGVVSPNTSYGGHAANSYASPVRPTNANASAPAFGAHHQQSGSLHHIAGDSATTADFVGSIPFGNMSGTYSNDGGSSGPTPQSPTSPAAAAPTATTLSGAIANNCVSSHAGGFANDNSGSYRLALVLVCLSLYEKEQKARARAVSLAPAGTATLGGFFVLGEPTPNPSAAALGGSGSGGGGGEKGSDAHLHLGSGGGYQQQRQQQSNSNIVKKVPEYHQAFSYIAAVLLLNMPEEEAFWALVCLLEDMLPAGFHDAFQMNTDLRILSEAVRERMPQLDANFSRHQVDMSVFASGWLQGLFCAHFPFASAARVLDVVFAEGNTSILIRLTLAFIRLFKSHFASEDSSCGAGQFANNWARECYDLDDVMALVAAEQKGSSDLMTVIENRRRELYSTGGGHQM